MRHFYCARFGNKKAALLKGPKGAGAVLGVLSENGGRLLGFVRFGFTWNILWLDPVLVRGNTSLRCWTARNTWRNANDVKDL
mgnify:CR=1 FL=1